jgi:hypothetical protein
MRKKINEKGNGVKNLTPQDIWQKLAMRVVELPDGKKIRKSEKSFSYGKLVAISEN